jgi:hypothetical protein
MRKIIFALIIATLTTFPLMAKSLSHKAEANIAMKVLKKQGNKFDLNFEEGGKPIHTIVGYFNIPDSKDETILITETHLTKGGDCHACGASLSFFHFKGNKLLKSSIDSLNIGDYGKAPKRSELKVKKLKGDVLALFYTSFDLAQGYEGDFLNIYNISESKAVHMLFLRLSMNNEATFAKIKEKWNSTYKLDKDSNIKLNTSGKKGGKSFIKDVIIKFDGAMYNNQKQEI